MLHQVRWTSRKLADRFRLIEPLVYRRKEQLLLDFCSTSTTESLRVG